MSFPYISFIKEPYNSIYGSKSLQKKFNLDAANPVTLEKPEKFEGRYKKQRKISNFAKTAILLAATAFGVYKGKGVIQKGVGAVGGILKKGGGAFASKCPNMSQALKSLGQALKAPLKPFKAIGGFFAKHIGKGKP